jgi:circadian clock protein KaiB
LYISGSTLKSALAVNNVKRVCEQHLKNRYDLEVIDVYQQPSAAKDQQLVAVPTLERLLPLPRGRTMGDLSKPKAVLLLLGLRTRKP